MWSYNPGVPLRVHRFRLFRFRSPLLTESRLLSLPPGTEMVHFPGFASPAYEFSRRYGGFAPRGLPHSEISGSQPACGSPKRIVACHVLLRLSAPRHPPYALSSLTIKFTQDATPRGVTGILALRVLVVVPKKHFRYSVVKDPKILVGLGGVEPPTSPLSGVRSSHLSYRPGPASWWS